MHSSRRGLVVIVAAALAVAAAGCGGAETQSSATTTSPAGRTIDVTMTDNAFRPAAFQVARGETVTFTFRNDGRVTHEAVLGDEAAQMSHHQQMTGSTAGADHHHDMMGTDGSANHGHQMSGTTGSSSSMGNGHAGGAMHDDDAVTVEPGRSGSITHTFSETGTYLIGCHEPGHWEAGMKATVEVT